VGPLPPNSCLRKEDNLEIGTVVKGNYSCGIVEVKDTGPTSVTHKEEPNRRSDRRHSMGRLIEKLR